MPTSTRWRRQSGGTYVCAYQHTSDNALKAHSVCVAGEERGVLGVSSQPRAFVVLTPRKVTAWPNCVLYAPWWALGRLQFTVWRRSVPAQADVTGKCDRFCRSYLCSFRGKLLTATSAAAAPPRPAALLSRVDRFFSVLVQRLGFLAVSTLGRDYISNTYKWAP